MRTTRAHHVRTTWTTLILLALCAPTAAGLAGADALATLHVPAGETLRVPETLLEVESIIVDGDLLATAGTLDLVASQLVVRGRILGAEGAPGADGTTLRLRVASLVVEPSGSIAAGAGGHGAPAIVPDGDAFGGHGGAGGSLVVSAATLDVRGTLAPGRGGDGGVAYGALAVGGDGGATGGLLVNDERLTPETLSLQGVASAKLADLVPPQRMSHCNAPVGADAAALSGANGGDACAHGIAGIGGADGDEGDDDNCGTCGNNNHPPCGNYTPQGGDNKNGEKGQHGASYGIAAATDRPAPPTLGGPATAIGGRGGDVASAGQQAGRGGHAVATGGAGGRGGWGGMGGNAGATGNGCAGGNGGNGAPGGAATATGGLQGVNPFDCTKNGLSGTPTATGGSGGSLGYGGAGGGGNWPYTNGAGGSTGSAGAAGAQYPTTPPVVPCVPPGAPTLAASHLPLGTCNRVGLHITQPATTGNSAILSYKVWRGLSTTSLSLLATVAYTGLTQTYNDYAVVNGTTYHYQVSAVTPAGEGVRSNLVSKTPQCLTVSSATTAVPVALNDPVSAPTLLATPGPGAGVATLTITHPPAPSSPVLSYNLYRSLSPNPTTLVTNFAKTGTLTQTYTDTGLVPVTQYFYKVVAVTVNGEEGASNEATVIAPLMIGSGSGTGNAVEEVYAEGFATKRGCDAVPVHVALVREGESFDLSVRLGEGRSTDARASSNTFCEETPRQESRVYSNRHDEVRRGDCGVLVTPSWFYEEKTSFEAGHTVTCDGRVAEDHYVFVELSGGRGWFYYEVVTYGAKGEMRVWRVVSNLVGFTNAPTSNGYEPVCDQAMRKSWAYTGVGDRTLYSTCWSSPTAGVVGGLPYPNVPPAVQDALKGRVDPIVAPFAGPQPDPCSASARIDQCKALVGGAGGTYYETCLGAWKQHPSAGAFCMDVGTIFLWGGAWSASGCVAAGAARVEPRAIAESTVCASKL